MKRTVLILLFINILFICDLSAQVALKGEVIDKETSEPLSFASVILKSTKDSLSVKSTITDLNGLYSFQNVKTGNYMLIFDLLGYNSKTEMIKITLPSTGYAISRKDTLSCKAFALDGVTISAVRTQQTSDRRIFTFSRNDLEQVYGSLDLLKTLPILREDMVNDRLIGINGGTVQFLINGAKATYNDIRMIPKEKIKRIETYDIPPIRYQNVESVVNIICSSLDNGMTLGAELNHAFSTGFANDNIYFSCINGKHKISAEYAMNYRNYHNKLSNFEYCYNISNDLRSIKYRNQEKFGYTTHIPNLKYAYINENKTIVEANLKPRYERRFSTTNGSGIYNNGRESNDSIISNGSDKIKIFNPSLDLYLWKKITDDDEIIFNTVITFYKINRNNWKEEQKAYTNDIFYNDRRVVKNLKKSIIGEVVYSKNFTNLKWNSGYQLTYSTLNSETINRFSINKYKNDFFSHNFYTELNGFYKQFLYRVSMGMTHINNHAYNTKFEKIYFTPKIILGYNISKNQTFRIMFDRTTIPYNLNDLSNSISDISIDILATGNPNLKNEVQNKITTIYNLNSKYIDVALTGIYMRTNNYIIDYFKLIDNKYWSLKGNGIWREDYGIALAANIKPLGNNVLRANLLLLPSKTRLKSDYLNYSGITWENEFGLYLNLNPISVSYQYTIPIYRLQGSYRTLSENQHHLNIKYRFGDWRVAAGILFIGKSSHYATETLLDSKVEYKSDTYILDNKNMITIGLSYQFNKGKSKSYNKKLLNQDNIAPIR